MHLNGVTRSRLGWLLVCLHAAWFFLAIANMSTPAPGLGKFFDQGGGSSATLLAGRPFHFEYESLLLKLLILVDVPSTLATVPLSFALLLAATPFHLGFYQGSYLSAAMLLLGASCQWLVVGHQLDRWFVCKRWGTSPRQHSSMVPFSRCRNRHHHAGSHSDNQRPEPEAGLPPWGNLVSLIRRRVLARGSLLDLKSHIL
jgi:hypothetical protein